MTRHKDIPKTSPRAYRITQENADSPKQRPLPTPDTGLDSPPPDRVRGKFRVKVRELILENGMIRDPDQDLEPGKDKDQDDKDPGKEQAQVQALPKGQAEPRPGDGP